MNPICNFEIYTDLSEKYILSLSDQGVDVDDWDYLLFFPANGTRAILPYGFKEGPIEPKENALGRLLNGSYKNVWYFVDNFMGRSGVIGVAYH